MADLDLDALLDDALDDLESSTQVENASHESKEIEEKSNVTNDEEEKTEHSDATSHGKSDEDKAIDEALNAVNASMMNAASNAQSEDDTDMNAFFNNLFQSFSQLDGDMSDEQIDKALKKLMTSFFDLESLKDPIQTIAQRYPTWLESSKSKLTEKEYEAYSKQCALYVQADTILQQPNPNMESIMDLLTQTFSYGSLPSEVMDGVMPDELKAFAQQMNTLEKQLGEEEERANASPGAPNSNSDGNEEAPDMEKLAEEYQKFMREMMANGQMGNGQAPDMPQLSPEEMQQFQDLMRQDCILM